MTAFPRPNAALIEGLRARIRRLEGGMSADTVSGSRLAALGDPRIDAHLPGGGLPRACLHAISGGDGAATGFCAGLLARLVGARGTALWCRRDGDLYGPGLAAFGLTPERLIVVRARRPADVFWAMEEALRSGAPAAVLGEAATVEPTAARRLQLAAEAGGVTGLLLTGNGGMPLPAASRWRVATVASAENRGFLPTAPRWQVELLSCRGGRPAEWTMEWRDGTGSATAGATAHGFAVVADLCHRPALPANPGPVLPAGGLRRAG